VKPFKKSVSRKGVSRKSVSGKSVSGKSVSGKAFQMISTIRAFQSDSILQPPTLYCETWTRATTINLASCLLSSPSFETYVLDTLFLETVFLKRSFLKRLFSKRLLLKRFFQKRLLPPKPPAPPGSNA
jgi:hypothetical protein